ncbi:MAG: acetate/propionate family kinase [Firmicutes bacterium]|nr:acetate/propionate family kinase [Bacillota bacterium]
MSSAFEPWTILTINGGSSSLKFALFAVSNSQVQALGRGAIENIGESNGRAWYHPIAGEPRHWNQPMAGLPEAVDWMLRCLTSFELPPPRAIGHRIVAGGPECYSHQRIDAALLAKLRRAIAFAPLHLPANLALVEALIDRYPEAVQVACFDTAFHHGLPEIASRLPLPRELWQRGVRKYGFHGLSFEYIVDYLGPSAYPRLIVAHLGNGSSLAAIRDGRPVDTTMGLTPTGGVMMGTRSGDLDPGVVLYLLEQRSPAQVSQLLNQQSGLLGVSGISGDMQTLLASPDERAKLAVDMYVYAVAKAVGALAAALGGLDGLVFTGGIGQHAPLIRQKICERLAWMGVALSEPLNRSSQEDISAPNSPIRVLVIPTDEERMIARHTYRVAHWDDGPGHP